MAGSRSSSLNSSQRGPPSIFQNNEKSNLQVRSSGSSTHDSIGGISPTPPRRSIDQTSLVPTIPESIHGPPVSYWAQLKGFAVPSDAKADIPIGISERLYRLNLTYLFNELTKIKKEVTSSEIQDEKQMIRLGELLHRYTEAVKDYEYMSQLDVLPVYRQRNTKTQLQRAFHEIGDSGQHNEDPYFLTYRTIDRSIKETPDAVRQFLSKTLPRSFTWDKSERQMHRVEYDIGDAPVKFSPMFNALAQFLIGLLGALWLIVPFLVMAFDPSKAKTVITVCVSVVFFALVISVVFKMDNEKTVTATATYAAVMVVFVGGT